MVQFTMVFFITVSKHYLGWKVIKMDWFIMGNGKIMLEMVGEFIKTNQLVIDMQDNGNKIENLDMGERVL